MVRVMLESLRYLQEDGNRWTTTAQKTGSLSMCRDLQLKQPIYSNTATYGHFGRSEFTWEQPKVLRFWPLPAACERNCCFIVTNVFVTDVFVFFWTDSCFCYVVMVFDGFSLSYLVVWWYLLAWLVQITGTAELIRVVYGRTLVCRSLCMAGMWWQFCCLHIVNTTLPFMFIILCCYLSCQHYSGMTLSLDGTKTLPFSTNVHNISKT